MNTQQYLKDIGIKISLLIKAEEVDNNFIIDNTKFSLTELQFILKGKYSNVTIDELKQIISLITGYNDNQLNDLYSLIEYIPKKQLFKTYKKFNEYNNRQYKPIDYKIRNRKRRIGSLTIEYKKEKPLTPAQIKKEKIRTVNDKSLCKRCYVCKNPLFIKFDAYTEKIINEEIVYIHDVCLEDLE